MQPELMLVRIAEAVALGQRGDRSGARTELGALWEQLGTEPDALHCCALAHAMADVQDDPGDELVWDLRALEAAHQVTDDRVVQAGMSSSAAGLRPSLHLNLGEVYRRLGDPQAAHRHLALGRAAAGALSDDGYSAVILRGLRGLEQRLSGMAN